MAVSLQKGGNISLAKEAPGITNVLAGLGWSARATDGAEFDLDVSVFILGAEGKIRSDQDFVFYNNPKGASDSVVHKGDNRSGAGEGDDEQVAIDLKKLPADVAKVVFAVTIHEAESRKQNFGQVSDAYIRLVNETDGKEVARYDLSEDASTETAMIFGEFYRHGEDFKFKAVGQGFAGGLAALAKNFGVNLA